MIPARSPGANPVRQAAASWGEVSQVDAGHPERPVQQGLHLAGQGGQDPGAAVEAAAGLLAGFGQAGLGHDEGEERLGAHAGPGQVGLQVVVDDPGQGRARRVGGGG